MAKQSKKEKETTEVPEGTLTKEVKELLVTRVKHLAKGEQGEAKKIRARLRKTHNFYISRHLPAESEFKPKRPIKKEKAEA